MSYDPHGQVQAGETKRGPLIERGVVQTDNEARGKVEGPVEEEAVSAVYNHIWSVARNDIAPSADS